MYIKGMIEDVMGRVQYNLSIPLCLDPPKYTHSQGQRKYEELLAYHKTQVITPRKTLVFCS